MGRSTAAALRHRTSPLHQPMCMLPPGPEVAHCSRLCGGQWPRRRMRGCLAHPACCAVLCCVAQGQWWAAVLASIARPQPLTQPNINALMQPCIATYVRHTRTARTAAGPQPTAPTPHHAGDYAHLREQWILHNMYLHLHAGVQLSMAAVPCAAMTCNDEAGEAGSTAAPDARQRQSRVQ